MTIVHCVTVRMSTMTATLAAAEEHPSLAVLTSLSDTQLTRLRLCSPTSNSRSCSSMASSRVALALDPRAPD